MTVTELIRVLEQMPVDWPVYIRGYEYGVDDVIDVRAGHFIRDVNDDSWGGKHEKIVDAKEVLFNGVEVCGLKDSDK